MEKGGSIQQVTSRNAFTCTFTWQTPFALFYFSFQTFTSIKIRSWHQEQSFPVLEESTCSGTYLFASVNRWSPYTRRGFGIPYRLGKGHTDLQAYKHYCWPFLCTCFPKEVFHDSSWCCCPSWLVTHQETSEGWQTAPLPLHVPVPPGFPLEEGSLSCEGCHSTPCLYLGPRTE